MFDKHLIDDWKFPEYLYLNFKIYIENILEGIAYYFFWHLPELPQRTYIEFNNPAVWHMRKDIDMRIKALENG